MSDVVVVEVEPNVDVVVEVAPDLPAMVEVPEGVAVIEVLTPGPRGPVGNIPVSVDPPDDPSINDLWVPIPP